MPPIKMNPSISIEAIKGEYFDGEYTKMSPRLSIVIGNDYQEELADL